MIATPVVEEHASRFHKAQRRSQEPSRAPYIRCRNDVPGSSICVLVCYRAPPIASVEIGIKQAAPGSLGSHSASVLVQGQACSVKYRSSRHQTVGLSVSPPGTLSNRRRSAGHVGALRHSPGVEYITVLLPLLPPTQPRPLPTLRTAASDAGSRAGKCAIDCMWSVLNWVA